MKILCVIDSLGSGGAQRQLTGLAKMLKEKGYSVKIVVWIHRQNDVFFIEDLVQNGVGYSCVRSLQNRYKRFFYIQKLIREEKPQVIISYYPGISSLLCLYRFVFFQRFKLIVSERSLTRKLYYKSRIKYFLYRFSDYIVPNATTEAVFLKATFPYLGKKVIAINNFVDQSRFFPKKKEESDYIKTKAIFVGRFTEAKNIPGLLKAIKLIKNAGYEFEIDFYGHSHQKQYHEFCINLAEELDIMDCVNFNSQIESIENQYREHNLLLLTSLWEGYPNVLCEAMSCGLPVLCSNISDISLIMENGNNGYLFDPEVIEDIASKIIIYLNLDISKKKRMGDRSAEIAKKKFSTDSFINQYLKIIR